MGGRGGRDEGDRRSPGRCGLPSPAFASGAQLQSWSCGGCGPRSATSAFETATFGGTRLKGTAVRATGPFRNTPVPPSLPRLSALKHAACPIPRVGLWKGLGRVFLLDKRQGCSVADTGQLQSTCRNARGRPVPVSATSGDGRPVCLFSKCGDASGSGHTDRFAEVKNARRGTAKDMAQRTSDPVATRLRLRVARARLEVNRPLASPRDTELAAPAARLGSGVSLPQTAPVLRRHHEPRAATAGGRGPRRPQRRRHARAPSTAPLPPQLPGSGGAVRTS